MVAVNEADRSESGSGRQDRQLLGLLRRPAVGAPGRWSTAARSTCLTGDWLAELTMLILARTQAKRPGGRLRPHLRDPDGAGDGHLPRPGHQGRHQRRRARPRRLRGGGARRWPTGSAWRPASPYVDRRRPAGPARRARRGRPSMLRPPRHRRGARRPPSQVRHRQRLPRLLGHRRRARARRRHRRHRPRHRRRRRLGPAALAPRLGAHRLGRARRRRRGRPRHRVRRPGHRRQLLVLHRGRRISRTRASRSPRSPPTARASSPSTRARAARSTIGTVTSQLLYEIGGPATSTPTWSPASTPSSSSDDGARPGPHRRRARRAAAADAQGRRSTTLGGYRNSFTFCLTGLDIEAKAELVEDQVLGRVPGRPRGLRVRPHASSSAPTTPDPATNEAATALLRITVKDPDERKVGRAFSSVAVELALATIPGFFGAGRAARGEPVRRVLAGVGARRPRARSTVARRRRPTVVDDAWRRCERPDAVEPAAGARSPVAARRPDACAPARPRRRRALGRQGRQRQPRRVRPLGRRPTRGSTRFLTVERLRGS